MGLWPLGCWDCEFEFRQRHGVLSLVCVCCALSGGYSCDGPSLMCLSVIVKPQQGGGLVPSRAVEP